MKGLQYIDYLLKNAGRNITYFELYEQVNGNSDKAQALFMEEEIPLTDEQTIKECKVRMQQLESESDLGENPNKLKEYMQIAFYLEETSLRGQPRMCRDNKYRCKHSIICAITEGVKLLKKTDPEKYQEVNGKVVFYKNEVLMRSEGGIRN